MTNEQLAMVLARRVDATAREAMRSGLSLTHREIEAVGEEGCDWISKRLGLVQQSTDVGADFVRVNRCPDCGEPGERKGHQTCQYPQD